MGCSQTKKAPAEPQPATAPAEPQPATLLNNSEKKESADWDLRVEAVRVFDLADKDHNGQLDMKELSNVRNSPEMAEAMMGKVDTDLSGTVSQDEWVAYFKQLHDKNEKSAAAVLKLYEKQIGENKTIKLNVVSDLSLRAEVSRVFDLADKDHNGQLDMKELTNVRNSPEMAEAMMGNVDADLSGTVSRDEWVGYFKKLFDKNEKSAAVVLKLYEKQIGENKTIKLLNSAETPAEPVVMETEGTPKQGWCC